MFPAKSLSFPQFDLECIGTNILRHGVQRMEGQVWVSGKCSALLQSISVRLVRKNGETQVEQLGVDEALMRPIGLTNGKQMILPFSIPIYQVRANPMAVVSHDAISNSWHERISADIYLQVKPSTSTNIYDWQTAKALHLFV
ncbi:MAG: hypothetical protein NWR72_04420 [Bacteroidia bacterium]|nr:hypothetical protein [Bacteroidia bacterium]